MLRLRAAVLLLISCLGAAACTGPARTATDYRLKARHSAQTASSAVATSSMAARLVKDRGAFATYVAVVLNNAEDDATSVASTFGSIQPPDVASDHLRAQLTPVLSQAVDTISRMRIAARRHEWATVLKQARSLPAIERSLQHFAKLPA